MLEVWIDGLCEPVNPRGIATYGFLVKHGGLVLAREKGVIGRGNGMSNNLAEYTALTKALCYLIEHNYTDEDIVVYSDSRLLVNQMLGIWNCNGGYYYPEYKRAKQLVSSFNSITFIWIPREQNMEADSLSREAYEEYCRKYNLEIKYHPNKKRQFTPKQRCCANCKWIRFSGPHVGCFLNYKYQKWLPKKAIWSYACANFEPA